MSVKVHNYGSGDWGFHCPGCGHGHSFRVTGDSSRPQWAFNGDVEKPTFTPSLLYEDPATRCHSNVTDGKITFHGDCHHAMKGQTVELPDWE